MKKRITTAAVAALAIAAIGAPAASAAEEAGPCGSSTVTTTYHEVHELPEPAAAAVGLGETYEQVAHEQVECGNGPLPGVGIGPIFG